MTPIARRYQARAASRSPCAPRDLPEQGQGLDADHRAARRSSSVEDGLRALPGLVSVAAHEAAPGRSPGRCGPGRRGWPRSSRARCRRSASCSLASSSARRVGAQHDRAQLDAQPADVADPLGVLQQVQRAPGQRDRLGHVAGLRADDAGVPVRRGAGHRRAEPLRLRDGPVADLGGLRRAAGRRTGPRPGSRTAGCPPRCRSPRPAGRRARTARRRWLGSSWPCSRQIRLSAVAALSRVTESRIARRGASWKALGRGRVAEGVERRCLDVTGPE